MQNRKHKRTIKKNKAFDFFKIHIYFFSSSKMTSAEALCPPVNDKLNSLGEKKYQVRTSVNTLVCRTRSPG